MDNTTSTNRTPCADHEQNSRKPIIRSQTWIWQHTSNPAIPHSFPVERQSQSYTSVMIPPCVRHDSGPYFVVSTTGKNRRRADSSYPKQVEYHTNGGTNGDTIDSDTDPSVEMRSQIGPRTAHETCAERPNLNRGNRREKVRCATFCTVSKLCSNCDWMGDCWVAQRTCAQ